MFECDNKIESFPYTLVCDFKTDCDDKSDESFCCPQRDDERFCRLCPKECRCQGLAFVCDRPFIANNITDIRYLDASYSNMTFEDLRHNSALVYLKLSACGLKEFLLIAAGQAAIFRSVKANILTTDKNQKSKDIIIARRLISVAVSDFLCWFPIGLLGVLASAGVPIPGEVNVVMAIFVLPVNSALNPFLYTFNFVMEKRREKHEKKLLTSLEAKMATERE
nr:hypothetical protein BaRGS_028403 [Batillaria attramentaria]